MILNVRTKESIKTALAMTIAYGSSLSMDWDRPYWAGFAVAMISLSTVGQSLNKGAMRMLGTLLAVVVALTLIALFPQQRWWFMVALSIFVGLCAYLMHGTKRQYFWQVAGFVTVIICLDGGTNAANAFETALLRAEQTGLGILVYNLVTILLWPTSTRAARRPGDGRGHPSPANAGDAAIQSFQSGPGGGTHGQLRGVGGGRAVAAGRKPIEDAAGNTGALARKPQNGAGGTSLGSDHVMRLYLAGRGKSR